MATKSIHSPKNRYMASIGFAIAQEGIGSAVSYTSENIDLLKSMAADAARQASCETYVRIRENRATYPSFDWHDVAIYTLNGYGEEVATYPCEEPVLNTVAAIGERLDAARRVKRLTIAQLAEAVGVTEPTIGALLNGKGNVGVQTLVDVANALGVAIVFI